MSYDQHMSMTQAQRYCNRSFRLGYCTLQELFRPTDRDAYNSGVYGWNCDIFYHYVNGLRVMISTGYRNTRGENVPLEIINRYNAMLADARNVPGLFTAEYTRRIDEIRQAFLHEIVETL